VEHAAGLTFQRQLPTLFQLFVFTWAPGSRLLFHDRALLWKNGRE
jgi:hypothetical protein